jgi:hypothetical protein
MNNAFIQKSKQVYGFLLRFYPKKFQQEYGQEMQFVFSEHLTDTYIEHGKQGVTNLWIKTLIDLSQSLVVQHIINQKEGNSMKTKNTKITSQPNIPRVVAITLAVLAVPFMAMQFSNEVNWGPGDFILIGVLIMVAGLTYEFVIKQIKNTTHRTMLAVGILALVIWIWIELAVGLFTNLGS